MLLQLVLSYVIIYNLLSFFSPGLALIIFESTGAFNITASFTVISPRRGLYLTNCSATLSVGDHYCPGVHLIHENNTGLQSVYSAPGSCQGIQYGLFEKQCNPMTVHVTTVSQMDATGTDSCKFNYSNSLTSLTFAAHNNILLLL